MIKNDFHKRVHKTIEQLKQEKAMSKKEALDYLVKLGTHNPDGSVSDNYKGK